MVAMAAADFFIILNSYIPDRNQPIKRRDVAEDNSCSNRTRSLIFFPVLLRKRKHFDTWRITSNNSAKMFSVARKTKQIRQENYCSLPHLPHFFTQQFLTYDSDSNWIQSFGEIVFS